MNIKVVIGFYFENIDFFLKDKVNIIYDISSYIEDYHKIKFTDLNIFYRKNENHSDKNKVLKNNEKNRQKINEICNNFRISGFYFNAFKEEISYSDTKYELNYDYGINNTPGSYRIIIDSEIYKDINITEYFKVVYNYINNKKYKTNYGLLHFFDNIKLPSFVLSGALTEKLDDDEVSFAKAWAHNQQLYKSYIRDVCWGNIVSMDIITPEIMKKIISIVGKNNYWEVDNKHIFFLPFRSIDEIQINFVSYNTIRMKIREILKQYNLLMPIEFIKR